MRQSLRYPWTRHDGAISLPFSGNAVILLVGQEVTGSMIELLVTVAITVSSVLMFGYWFRYTCLLMLSAKTARDYARGFAMANQLSFLDVQSQLRESNADFDGLRDALDRDYELISNLLQSANVSSLEDRILAFNYRMMRTSVRHQPRIFEQHRLPCLGRDVAGGRSLCQRLRRATRLHFSRLAHFETDLWEAIGSKTNTHSSRHTRLMDIMSMLAEIRAERERLTEAILVLERIAAGGRKRRGRPPKWMTVSASGDERPAGTRRSFSAATRAKMAQAQKKRWAAKKKAVV